jgi:phage/plasmid-associated DNA primase
LFDEGLGDFSILTRGTNSLGINTHYYQLGTSIMTENSAIYQPSGNAIDRDQTLKHLELLRYQDGDTVYLRAIPSEAAEAMGTKARNITATYQTLPWVTLESLQSKGCGLYVVVNGGGHKDENVTQCRAIFYEHDDLPLDLQMALWQTLGLPAPTLQVNTGGKSIHNYWVFDTLIPAEDWRTLQVDLLKFADADLKINNPSRVMRLAGTTHQGTGSPATIVSSSGRRYAYDELRAIVPVQERPTKLTRTTTSRVTTAIPLIKCLSKKHRDMIAGGVGEGGRNAAGAALSRDLIGTANYLQSEGVDYDGNPRSLFDQFCDACSPPLDQGIEKIWRSAERDNPSPCLSADKIANCVAAWQHKQQSPQPATTRQQSAQGDGGEDNSASQPQTTFLQVATADLFPGRWVAFGGVLYEWAGTHYQERSDDALSPKLQKYANKYVVEKWVKESGYVKTYPHANPGAVKSLLEWVKLGFAVTADRVNPPGINCTNGILMVHWEGRRLVNELVPHSPDQIYLGEPTVRYDPDADPTEFERLMDCLDPKPREIWERTIAASIDLPTVRRFQGRGVRALLLKGDGANGKDTLRVLVAATLGPSAMCGVSITDWAQYDQGRKFGVYSLRGRRVSWPSENADIGRIDKLQGLKAAITGDDIDFEAKNKQGSLEPPSAVFLFNLNESPNLVAGLKATASRWGIVPFSKTYSSHPGEGELQADPRFKQDPAFVFREVAPAFLNRLLVQLQAVVIEGIDYSATQDLFDEIQRNSSHLMQFAHDTGLQYSPGGSVTVKELWERLQEWYIDTGTLAIEEGVRGGKKLLWTDQVKAGDKNVKGQNQVLPRFLEIFPKARKATQRLQNSRNYEPLITGIKFFEFGLCSKTGQDGQDAQESMAKPVSENGLQPFCPKPQLGKIGLRSAQEDSEVVKKSEANNGGDKKGILTSLPPILTSVLPSDDSETDTQKEFLDHLDHLAQFSDIIQIQKTDSDFEEDISSPPFWGESENESPPPDKWEGVIDVDDF